MSSEDGGRKKRKEKKKYEQERQWLKMPSSLISTYRISFARWHKLNCLVNLKPYSIVDFFFPYGVKSLGF
jgi:hypothetical protein